VGSSMNCGPPNISLQRTAPCGLAAELGSFAAVIMALLLSAGCSSSLSAIDPRPATNLDAEDRAILIAVLVDPELSRAACMDKPAMVNDTTDLSPSAVSFDMTIVNIVDNRTDTLERSLTQVLYDRNHSQASLRSVPLPRAWTFLPAMSSRFTGDGYRRVITVSLPGLSADHRRVVVAVSRDCNQRRYCSDGYAVVLEKRDSQWGIVGYGDRWIA
jgi:hypothetical protein